MKQKSRFQIWKLGARHGIPVALGYFAVSFAFGIQAAGIGISTLQAALLSLLNLTSAGQLASLDIIAAGGSYLTLALQQFVVNIRYMLMSASLSQNVEPSLSTGKRMTIAYGLSDEVFALSALYPKPLDPVYTYGIISVAVPGWTIGTLMGAAMGQILPARVVSALGLAIYGMFLAIIIPDAKKSRPVLAAVLAAMAGSVALRYCPGLNRIPVNYRLIVVTLAVGFAMALIAPAPEEDEDGTGADSVPLESELVNGKERGEQK